MVFQILDDKRDCVGFFANGEFIYEENFKNLDSTWNYSDHLRDEFIHYGYIWSGGQSIRDVCPEHLKNRFLCYENKIKAHFKSFNKAKINFEDVCFYDLVPQKHLQHYFQVKNEICEWVFENFEEPRNYSFMHEAYLTIQDIAKNRVNINMHKLYNLAKTDIKARNLLKWMQDNPHPTVNYNLFGSKTGRLTTRTGSFPIMNLKKELKPIVEPKWDCFLELDFNAAEIRTLLSLSGENQPQGDIHEWHQQKIFKQEISRDEAKQKFFAWLYNPNSQALESSPYDKQAILGQYYREEKIHTKFGRQAACGPFHALNYVLQSHSSDNCLERVSKINVFLRDRKSYVAFTIHDCCIIDLHRDDRCLIPQLKEIFEDTKLGKFPSSCHIGHNLGDMREFTWHP
tara:strand:+ start:14189 stop:15385 length:1197 start_codon:yes stop_codon:yes gene_type:complete